MVWLVHDKLKETGGVMSKRAKQNYLLAATLIFTAVIMRLVPHVPNFAPMTATAIFGAAYLPRKYALLLPLAAVAISDYFLLYINPFSAQMFDFSTIHPLSAMFHGTTVFVWASFMISALLGLGLRSKRSVPRVGGVAILAAIQFYLVTNFGVWAAGAYARDISGLLASYVAGLPFLRWTLIGDLFFTASFFAIYEYAKATQTKLAVALQRS